jgi:hypothetical protein
MTPITLIYSYKAALIIFCRLWVAGRLLSHPTEHREVVNLIKRIELVTGWGTTWRITDLMGIWGYTSNDFM